MLSLALLSSVYGAPASAASGARIAISGEVPIMCRSEVDLADRSGTLDEFCNDPAGYDVYLDHGSLPAAASVTIDGAAIALSSSGSTRISASDRAAIRTRNVVFDVPAGSQLTVRMVPR